MDTKREIVGYDIIVIQSLKECDCETGKILFHDIIQYKPCYRNDIHVEFYDVSTLNEFQELFSKLEQEIPSDHILTLHFETHGCDDGIGLSSGEIVCWKDFFSLIRPLNIKTSNLLTVVMSMCKGAAISSYLEPTKRCPYRVFIGFEHNMDEKVLLEAFSTFYETYNNMLDITVSWERMNNVLPKEEKAWLIRAQDIFESVLNPDTNLDSFNSVVDNYYNGFDNQGQPLSREQYKEQVRQCFINLANENRSYYNFKE